jgi:hypothetical protein
VSTEEFPSAARPYRVLFIFEYAQPADDWMMASLVESLDAARPGLKPTFVHGFFGVYKPGGLNLRRLANLAWVYLQTAVLLPSRRYDAVLVRSTPPGIQIWTEWWARLRGVPVLCWLMDYHPEIEARQLERRGFLGLARLLRRIDSASMRRFAAVVVLDRAMARVAQSQAADVKVIEHPTWGPKGNQERPSLGYIPRNGDGPLRLAYSGNLGAAHDLSALGALLAELAERGPVELFVIGASAQGNERFQGIGASWGIKVTTRARVPFGLLLDCYNEWHIDAGVVLMSEESSGLLSPSKFSGYIQFGLPLVYVGPPETNAHLVCSQFNGGFWLPCRASKADVAAVARSLLNGEIMKRAAEGARSADGYFSRQNQDSLAAQLAPWMKARAVR